MVFCYLPSAPSTECRKVSLQCRPSGGIPKHTKVPAGVAATVFSIQSLVAVRRRWTGGSSIVSSTDCRLCSDQCSRSHPLSSSAEKWRRGRDIGASRESSAATKKNHEADSALCGFLYWIGPISANRWSFWLFFFAVHRRREIVKPRRTRGDAFEKWGRRRYSPSVASYWWPCPSSIQPALPIDQVKIVSPQTDWILGNPLTLTSGRIFVVLRFTGFILVFTGFSL